eukprot:349696-Chlamydomonas_euryale.AAC.3
MTYSTLTSTSKGKSRMQQVRESMAARIRCGNVWPNASGAGRCGRTQQMRESVAACGRCGKVWPYAAGAGKCSCKQQVREKCGRTQQVRESVAAPRAPECLKAAVDAQHARVCAPEPFRRCALSPSGVVP